MPSKGTVLGAWIVLIIVVMAVLLTWGGAKASTAGPPCLSGAGACALDADCGGPERGRCNKGANGDCACICKPGFSGSACQSTGPTLCRADGGACAPGDSCDNEACGMGLCGAANECVCPPDPNNPAAVNWRASTNANGVTTKCGRCEIGYGPNEGGPAQFCSKQWQNGIQLLTNNCSYQYDATNACNEFALHMNDVYNVNGFDSKGSVSPALACDGDYAAHSSGYTCGQCGSTDSNQDQRWLCNVAGWLDSNVVAQTCPNEYAPDRDHSSYSCCGYNYPDCNPPPGQQ